MVGVSPDLPGICWRCNFELIVIDRRCTGEIPETAKKTNKVKEKISKKQAALNRQAAAAEKGKGQTVEVTKKEAVLDAVESEDEEVEVDGKDDER